MLLELGVKLFPLLRVCSMVPASPTVNPSSRVLKKTPLRLLGVGLSRSIQFAPPLLVQRMTPLSPTMVIVVPFVGSCTKMSCRSRVTPELHGVHVTPAFVDRTMVPLSPTAVMTG